MTAALVELALAVCAVCEVLRRRARILVDRQPPYRARHAMRQQ